MTTVTVNTYSEGMRSFHPEDVLEVQSVEEKGGLVRIKIGDQLFFVKAAELVAAVRKAADL